MKFTMKRTLALALALMLAMPTFAFADGAAEAQDANGQITANELVLNDSPVLDDDLLLDGDLVLDDLSLDLTQPDDPTGDLELGSQDPSEGDAGEQPDASEAGAPGESPLELGDDAQVTGEEIPDPQPLMPPDYALDTVAEGENVTDPAMAANDGVTTWKDLADIFSGIEPSFTLNNDLVKTDGDTKLLRTSAYPLTLDLGNYTIRRNDLNTSTNDGYVIKTAGSLTINGSGTISGGKNSDDGGGIIIYENCDLEMNGGTITGNQTSGNGGGVFMDGDNCSFTMKGGTITSNSGSDNGGGVYVNGNSFSIGGGSTIKITGNKKGENANNVYLPDTKKINVIGELTEGSTIGVSTEKVPDVTNGYIPITNKFLKTYLPEDPVFQSDNSNYVVGVMEENDGEIQLGLGCEILQTANDVEAVYNGQPHGIQVNVTNPTVSGKTAVAYKGKTGQYDETTNPTFTKAGTYEVEYQVSYVPSDSEKQCFFPVEDSATVKITRKEVALDWSGQDAYTYSGQGQGPGATIKSDSIVNPDEVGVTVMYKAKDAEDSTLTSDKPTNAGNYVAVTKLTGTDKDNYKLPDITTKEFTITAKELDNDTDDDGSEDADSNVIITLDPSEYTYDGTEKKPAVTVKDKKTSQVVPAKEYSVDYRDNVNAGTAKVTITDVKGGNYTVSGVKTFTINEAAMTVSASGYKEEFDGKAHGITVTVTKPSTGYTIKYGTKEGTYDKDSLTYTDVGNYTVYYQVTAKNYKAVSGSAKVEITTKGLDNDTDGDGSEDADGNVIIALDPAEYTYDGTAKEPAVTVTDKDTQKTVPEKEYKVAYSDNVNAGTAKVTISDVAGGNYVVNGVKTFTIKEAAMTVAAEGYKGEYDGEAHGITVTVTTPKTDYTVKYGEKEGTYDKDSLTYTDAGVYTVYYKVTAKNYVAVTGSASVEITAKDDRLTIELGKSEYTYNGEGKRPSVTVKYDGKVVPATEYKVTYSNNKHAGTANVTISDVPGGQYTVSGNKTFTILPKTVGLKWKSTAFVYDGDDHVPTAKAMGLVKKDKCKVSVSGAATEAGNHTARATKLSNPDYALPKNVTKTFIISARGSGSGDTTFSAEKQTGTVTYDGTPQEPEFVVHCTISEPNGIVSNRVLTVPASEYRIVYRNNVNAGTATVVVTDVPGGNFEVNCRAEFTIARRKATVTANDQRAKTVDDIKTGVNAVKVQGLIKGHVLESVKLDVDIKAGAKKGSIIPGKAKIVDAEGKDVTKNYKFDYVAGSLAVAQKYDPEPKPPKPDFTLLAQMKACGGDHTLRLTWTQVPEADGYELTFVKEDCSFTKAKSVSVHGLNTWKFTGLKKNTAYKAYVRAWKHDGNKRTYIGKSSPVVCAITGNFDKHNTNADSVRVNTSRLKLKVGERAKVEANVKGVKSGKDVMRWDHALLRWYSDDANVATVNARGEIRAVAAGECTVYALAANGVWGTVKVKVK